MLPLNTPLKFVDRIQLHPLCVEIGFPADSKLWPVGPTVAIAVETSGRIQSSNSQRERERERERRVFVTLCNV